MPLTFTHAGLWEMSLDEWARSTARRLREKRDQEKYEALVSTVRPMLLRAFPGGWWHGNPFFVGDFDDEEFFDGDAGEYRPGLFSIECPHCTRKFHPLLSKSRLAMTGGWRWVGLDHQEPYTDYFAACGWCGTPMLFTISTPQ